MIAELNFLWARYRALVNIRLAYKSDAARNFIVEQANRDLARIQYLSDLPKGVTIYPKEV